MIKIDEMFAQLKELENLDKTMESVDGLELHENKEVMVVYEPHKSLLITLK